MLAHIIESKRRYNTSNNAVESDPNPNDETIAITREFIKVSLDNYWDKFDEYYKTLDLSFVYAAAVILYPAYK